LFIVNPLTGSGFDNLFSTHPNPENRIQALEQLAVEMQQASFGPIESAVSQTRLKGPWG
jgi:heat shock protein HtpX